MENKKPNIGIVYSGGYSRAAAYAGFTKALLEKVDRSDISLISSCIVGSINAIALSKNKMDYLEEIYKTIDFVNRKNLRYNLKNNAVNDILTKLIEDEAKTEIPMYVSGYNFFPGIPSIHYYKIDENSDNEYIRKCINITTGVPFINGIFKHEFKHWYMMPAISEYVPVGPFHNHDCDLLIILHDDIKYIPPVKLVLSNKIVICVNVLLMVEFIEPRMKFNTRNLTNLFEDGYKYGKVFNDIIFKDDNLRANAYEFINYELKLKHDLEEKNKPGTHRLELKK